MTNTAGRRYQRRTSETCPNEPRQKVTVSYNLFRIGTCQASFFYLLMLCIQMNEYIIWSDIFVKSLSHLGELLFAKWSWASSFMSRCDIEKYAWITFYFENIIEINKNLGFITTIDFGRTHSERRSDFF